MLVAFNPRWMLLSEKGINQIKNISENTELLRKIVCFVFDWELYR
jgi:hypothetical protein